MADAYHTTDAERWAVTAHLLINELAIITGSATMLRQGWQGLSDERRSLLLGQLERHAHEVTAVLSGMARGTPDLVALSA